MHYQVIMKAATIHEIKKELGLVHANKLTELLLRMARYKKDNKELLTYLLFEASDEPLYIRSVKEEMELQFSEINTSNHHLAKKTIRKVLRTANKFARFSQSKQTELELRLHFCQLLKKSGAWYRRSQVMQNIYDNQVKKINDLMVKMHEDLRADYIAELNELQ